MEIICRQKRLKREWMGKKSKQCWYSFLLMEMDLYWGARAECISRRSPSLLSPDHATQPQFQCQKQINYGISIVLLSYRAQFPYIKWCGLLPLMLLFSLFQLLFDPIISSPPFGTQPHSFQSTWTRWKFDGAVFSAEKKLSFRFLLCLFLLVTEG